MESSHVVHPIPALYDDSSCILILGSFPSVKSRESRFFYGHPQNRYWRVLAAITEDEVPATVVRSGRSCYGITSPRGM